MNYNNYPGIGIDKKLLDLQNALSSHLGFLNVDFYGRVQKTLNKDGKSFVPEVHISNSERKEVYYDDRNAPGGNVFFVDSEEHTTKDGKLFSSKIKVVFMLNLDKLYQDKNYRADVEVQEHCVKLINKLRIFDVTGIEKGLSNVLKGFNIEGIKKNDLQPYHTFAVVGNLNYIFNCK
jgi:hypothetical protein